MNTLELNMYYKLQATEKMYDSLKKDYESLMILYNEFEKYDNSYNEQERKLTICLGIDPSKIDNIFLHGFKFIRNGCKDCNNLISKLSLENEVYKKAILKYSEKCDRLKYLEERIKIFNEISKQILIDHPHISKNELFKTSQLTFFFDDFENSSDEDSTSE
jgi:hypothetical protein